MGMTDKEHGTIDLAKLTRRLGQPDHEQSVVLAWSGESSGHLWTEAEVEELIDLWGHLWDVETPAGQTSPLPSTPAEARTGVSDRTAGMLGIVADLHREINPVTVPDDGTLSKMRELLRSLELQIRAAG